LSKWRHYYYYRWHRYRFYYWRWRCHWWSIVKWHNLRGAIIDEYNRWYEMFVRCVFSPWDEALELGRIRVSVHVDQKRRGH
jgi:hypothetical protein